MSKTFIMAALGDVIQATSFAHKAYSSYVITPNVERRPIRSKDKDKIDMILEDYEELIMPIINAFTTIKVELDTQEGIDRLALQLAGLEEILADVCARQNHESILPYDNPLKEYSNNLIDVHAHERYGQITSEEASELKEDKYTASIVDDIKDDVISLSLRHERNIKRDLKRGIEHDFYY